MCYVGGHASTGKSTGVGAGASRNGCAGRSGCQAVPDCGGARSFASDGRDVTGPGVEGRRRRGRCHAACELRAETLGPAAAGTAAAAAQGRSSSRLVHRFVDRAARAALDPAEVRRRVSCERRSHAAQVAGVDAAEAERRARERDVTAIDRWVHVDWPRIKESPPTETDAGFLGRKRLFDGSAHATNMGSVWANAALAASAGASHAGLGDRDADGLAAAPPTRV